MSIRRKPEFDRFHSGLSRRVTGWLDDPDYTSQDLTNIVRSELSRTWKYLMDRINTQEKELAEKDAKVLQLTEIIKDMKELPIAQDNIDLEKRMKQLEEKLKAAVESIEDLVMESEHLTGCKYDSYGHEWPCNCMDRNYFNRDDCMDRLKEVLAKIRGEK